MMPTEPIIFSMFILGVSIIVLMCVVIGYLYEPTNNEPITTAIGVFVLVAIPSALLGYGIAKTPRCSIKSINL